MISAFMVLALFIFISACDNEGIVGEGLNPSGERVQTSTYPLTDIEILQGNGFSGQLGQSALGKVDDPFYGSIHASALIKPSINPEDLDEFPSDHNLRLILEFNTVKYGDENSVSEYNLYEINQRWRGPAITYNNPVSYDETNLLGSFQVTDESSIEVDLDSEWVNRYRNYFNSDDAQRDSLYRFEFPGLAVVPADQNNRIDFLRNQTSANDTTDIEVTRFLIENQQDSVIATVPLLDFGTSFERSDEPETDNLILHNTLEQILKVNLNIDESEFAGKEIVNVQLVFDIDTTPGETAPPGFIRPQTQQLRAHYFSSEPLNIASEIFTTSAYAGTVRDSEAEQFRINVSSYFIDNMFGDFDFTPLYISNQLVNGFIYPLSLYGPDAPEDLRPRLIITTINPEN
ncbi:hypothetical protein DYD21_01970 [Rhodohalobacter sp. SW132]|uniref:hypothetical protein n=1 Tax=Rhodohalobacter sp. SW132 TaxID=2293433 RepID=UPI000E280F8B|nr:hypothetical protein [Rhodohalobacter sp. SW132]REL38741.1 hypothetical protein DYD21_01970 [Rhodohalobacter sp. SW132]